MARRNGIHGPYSDCIVLTNTEPAGTQSLPSGSTQIANGQIGLTFDRSTSRGLQVVNFTTGVNTTFRSDKSDRRFYIEVGTGVSSNAGGMTSKNIRSVGFRPEDVLEVTYSQSKPAVQAEVILGYDGLDTSKGMSLKPGEAATVSLRLEGLPLAFYGRKDGVFEGTFSMQMPESDDCNDNCLDGACYDVVNTVIDEILTHQMVEGIPLSTFIHAYPVTDCFVDANYSRTAAIYRGTFQDRGDDAALGKIVGAFNSQGNITTAIRTHYNADTVTSTYELLFDSDKGPNLIGTVYTSNLHDPICGSDDCQAAGGAYYENRWILHISASTVDSNSPISLNEIRNDLAFIWDDYIGTPGVSSSEVTGWSHGGTAHVSLVLDAEPTQEQIDDFIEATYSWEGAEYLVKLEELKFYEDYCVLPNTQVTLDRISDCTIGCQLYYIDLKDTDCQEDRLAELQAAYPELDVKIQQEGEPLGVSYSYEDTGTPDFQGDVPAGGGEFSVNIATDSNGKLIAVKIVMDSWDQTPLAIGDEFVVPGGAFGGPEDLVLTITSVGIGRSDTCFRRYHAYVESEIKCADPCYMEHYKFAAPGTDLAADPAIATSDFEFTRWKTHVYKNTDTTCNCGIAFKAKDLELCPPKEIADQIGVINSQIKIQVSGGELLGTKIGYPYNLKPFEVTYVSRAFDGTGWGEDYIDAEKQTYDRYLSYLAGDNYAQRWFKNTTTKLQPCVQYDTFTVKLRSSKHSQSFSQRKQETFRYIFVVPKGTYNTYAPFFNHLASANPNANALPSS